MLHKLFIHVSLILLFAFAQMGVVAHEISHLNDLPHHENQQNQGKNVANHQCEQCICHAGVADGLPTTLHIYVANQVVAHSFTQTATRCIGVSNSSYSARAPPQIT